MSLVLNPHLGSGLDFPVKYDAGRLEKAEGVQSVFAAIKMLFATRKGVRFMLPEYGSNLQRLLFEPCNYATGQRAAIYAREDILSWIPRVEDVDVEFQIQNEYSLISLVMDIRLRNSTVEMMMTYPFYLESSNWKQRFLEPTYAILSY